ncbi:MAG: VOC family protein [Burkholderiales bacterium]|nr:VOC family protein [Burkholderiales bacterium]
MNASNWFEIPAHDFNRASRYYETVLDIQLKADNEFAGLKMGIFPHDKPGSGGAVVEGKDHVPGSAGTLIYLHAPQLDAVLARIEPAGGAVLLPKMDLGDEIGYIAIMRDTEGNHIGLHQPV